MAIRFADDSLNHPQHGQEEFEDELRKQKCRYDQWRQEWGHFVEMPLDGGQGYWCAPGVPIPSHAAVGWLFEHCGERWDWSEYQSVEVDGVSTCHVIGFADVRDAIEFKLRWL